MSESVGDVRERPAPRGVHLPPETGILGVLVLVLLGGAVLSPNFLTVSNMLVLLLNGSVIGFLALGQTFVLLVGGIDLSGGSIVAMTCVLAAVLMEWVGLPWPLAALCVLGVGALTGWASGVVIDRSRVPPFIVTFAMMGVAASIPQIITGAESIRVHQLGFGLIGKSRPFGVPMPVIALAVASLMAWLLLRRTVIGMQIYAVGGNREAARLTGVPVSRRVQLVYALSGLCAAAGGLVYASRLMTGYPTAGRGDELFFSIAGAVVGGVSLFGGIGTVQGALLGVALIATISNMMNVTGVDAYWQPLVIGLIILGGVFLDTMRSRRRIFIPLVPALARRRAGPLSVASDVDSGPSNQLGKSS